MSEQKYIVTGDDACEFDRLIAYTGTLSDREIEWLEAREYTERTCRFTLERDRDELAKRDDMTEGEWTTCDIPLAWTCSACGKQYAPVHPFPAWLKHCPECGAKVVGE